MPFHVYDMYLSNVINYIRYDHDVNVHEVYVFTPLTINDNG